VRHQKLPTPFFGTVVEDEADIGALEAVWCRKPMHQSAAPEPASGGPRPEAVDPGVASGLGSEARRPGGKTAPDDAARPPVRDAAFATGDAVSVPVRDAALPSEGDAALPPVGDAALPPVGDAAASAAGDAAAAPEPAQSKPDAAPLAGDTQALPVTMAVPGSRDAAAGPSRRFGSVDAARHIAAGAGSAANASGSRAGARVGSGSGAVAEANV